MIKSSDVANTVLANIQASWNEASCQWDPDALTAIYTDDALFFGGRPGHAAGSRAIRDYFSSYKGVIKSATVTLVEQHILWLASDCFLAQGYGEFSFVLFTEQRPRAYLRTTLAVVQQEGKWKIRQHHFSASPDSPPL